jgi:hypothetical protein
MARLIQKTGFISRKSAGGYMKYIATREGVEVLTGKGPATEKQKEMVAKLLKDFPDMRDAFEYEDYKQAPTLHTASALISAALDSHMQNLQSENGYLRYIATRPGAEKHGAHGLFSREDNANLTAAMHDLTSHDGNVWTIIYSLHREDAERLGYNNAAAWRKLLVSQQNKFAESFHVPASALHWYAAYHDADTHPHIHMMIWTDQETVLKRDAVVKLRSVMTNSIFQAELENLYIRKDIAYKDVTEAARTVMHDLANRMEFISEPPASIQEKLLELVLELRTVSGKKQYAYLKKPLKDMVDSIVDELEELPEVAAYYSVWNGVRDTLEGYYKNRPRQHNPLSQQKEFRAIKNAIIQEAERLRQQMELEQATSEQKPSQDEEPSAEKTSTDASTNPTLANENTSFTPSCPAQFPTEYLLNSTIRLFHQMGQIFRDNAAPPSNPMGIRIDSKRRKKLMQKRLAMGHKQDDHEQNFGQTLQ